MLLKGKRIIVTGGASGIAAATVRAYAREGARVASLDVNDELGRQVAAECGSAVEYFHCDVSKRQEIDSVFDAVVAKFGGLDVLAHVAAIEEGGPFDVALDDVFDRVMNVNLRGTCNTNVAAMARMKAHGGRIINFGSAAGIIGQPGSAYYAASKGAVMAWTRTVAQEWAQYGITVNSVAPIISTPMMQKTRDRMTPEQLEHLDMIFRMRIPLGGKPGDPDQDLAPVMVFLASDAPRFITGQVFPVDGGTVMLG